MAQDKLSVAAQAAGFAMVNPDDALVSSRDHVHASDRSGSVAEPLHSHAMTVSPEPTLKSTLPLDWFGMFSKRVPG